MRDASEEMGELASRAWVAQQFPNAKPLYARTRGDGKAGEFDQIYQTSDGRVNRIIIVEAKGGNGSLGSRNIGGKNVQQGHPDYRDNVIDNYNKQFERAKKDPNVSPEDFAKMQETNEALQATLNSENGDPPKFAVEYYVVRQPINKDGNLGDISAHQFK